jgi:hypothetical protein
VIATAQLMVVLDMTVVNIALPSAQKALHFTGDSQPDTPASQPEVSRLAAADLHK